MNNNQPNKSSLLPIPNLFLDKRDKQKAFLLALSGKFSQDFTNGLDTWAQRDGMLIAETITLIDYVYILFGRIEEQFYDDIPEHYRFDTEFNQIQDATQALLEKRGEGLSPDSEDRELSLVIVSVVKDCLDDIIERYHNVSVKKPPFWHKWIS